jgi:hypothetical protein
MQDYVVARIHQFSRVFASQLGANAQFESAWQSSLAILGANVVKDDENLIIKFRHRCRFVGHWDSQLASDHCESQLLTDWHRMQKRSTAVPRSMLKAADPRPTQFLASCRLSQQRLRGSVRFHCASRGRLEHVAVFLTIPKKIYPRRI